METKDILVIIAWAAIAFFLIGAGIAKTREQAAQRSQIFERGNEHYARIYLNAITGIEQEMSVWIRH